MKLVKILSDKVQIKTNQAEFENAKINDLLLVSDGNVDLVTMVYGLTDSETNYSVGDDDFLGEA